MLTIDKLQLVELHILGCFLKQIILLNDFFLQLLYHLQIFRTARSAFIKLLKLHELFAKLFVLLIHQIWCLCKLALHLLKLPHLLLNQLIHLLFQTFIKRSLFLVKFSFNLLDSFSCLLLLLFHNFFGFFYSVLHLFDLRVFSIQDALETVNFLFERLSLILSLLNLLS